MLGRKMMPALFLGALAAVTVTAAPPKAGSDLAKGKLVFAQRCQACHGVLSGQKRVGPTMAGVAGRKAGSLRGYDFSPNMRKSNIVWTAKNLDRFLQNPLAVVPKSKMGAVKVPNAIDRASLVVYLTSLK